MKCLKLFCGLLCIVFIQTICTGQQIREVDSLLNLIREEVIDTNQLEINNQIAIYYYDINVNKAIEYYTKTLKISEQLNQNRRIANCNYSLGSCYATLGDFDKSLEHYLKAARYFEDTNGERNASLTYSSIASLYVNFNKPDKALEYYLKCENLIKLLNDTFEMVYLYTGMSGMYFKQEKYDSSLIYNYKIRILGENQKDTSVLFSAFTNIGLIYKRKKEFAKALIYTDSAFQCVKSKQVTDFEVAALYNNYANIFLSMGRYRDADNAFHKSLALAEASNSTMITLENYKNMAELYKQTTDYKRHAEFLNKYFSLKDSLYNVETKTQLNQLESDYKLEKKDKLLVISNLEISKQINNRNIFLVITLFTVAILGLVYYFYKRAQSKNILLQKQNEVISDQKLQLEKLNQLKDRLFGIISHDIRNPLNTLRSYLLISDSESLNADKKLLFKKQTLSAVEQTSSMLENLLTWANLQIRNTEPNIVPISIQDCVEDVISVLNTQATQKNVKLTLKIEHVFIPSNADILSIALRNLITNAIKFSYENGEVIIHTEQTIDGFLLIVEDNGLGMTEDELRLIENNEHVSNPGTYGEKGSGLGLYLVREMLKRINAKLIIKSNIGEGSKFIVKF